MYVLGSSFGQDQTDDRVLVQSVRYCLVTEAVVKKEEPALYFSRGQRFACERRAEEEDGPEVVAGEEEGYDEEEKIRAAG